MMEILYLGHAGFLVEHEGESILMDPWFYPAFLGSWFPKPDNRRLLELVRSRRVGWLYISHLHEDHFDLRVLRDLDRDVCVLCPNYRSRAVQRKFKSLGFRNLVPLDHQQSLDLSPTIQATMILDTSHKEDSGLLLECSGLRFLDLNDCNAKLSELPGRIDLLAAQYSGAQWYPQAYNYPAEIMAAKVTAVRRDLMDTLIRKCTVTQAMNYLPCAGPPAFLDPGLRHHHDGGIFFDWGEVSAEFAARLPSVHTIMMMPGDRARCAEQMTLDTADATVPMNLEDYAELRRSEWEEFHGGEADITTTQIRDYFTTLKRRNPRLTAQVTKYFRLSTEASHWDVHLGSLAEDFIVETEEDVEPDYVLSVPSRVLEAILIGRIGWEEALLSMRVRLHRDPDVFDSRFMGLLRYGNEPPQTHQMAIESACLETCEHPSGLRFQRYCPHAGEDLTEAVVADGLIECPRHHWKWDAVTGACVSGGSIPLRIEPTLEAAKNAGAPN